MLNVNIKLRRELDAMKKQLEHIVTKNQRLSSHNFNTIECQSSMQEELALMEDTMAQLYDEMILLQKVVAPLISIKNKVQEVVKLLKVANKVIDQLQEWVAKYSDAPQHLERKYRITTDIDRFQLRLHHQSTCVLEKSRLALFPLTII